MRQNELDLAVAKVTGESICEIARMGFSLANPVVVDFDPEPAVRPPLIIDWDAEWTVEPEG
jgi:hypothetical protein